MKYFLTFVFSFSLIAYPAFADNSLVAIESCSDVPSEFAISFLDFNNICEVQFTDGSTKISQYNCELTVGCPQDLSSCAFSMLAEYNFNNIRNELNLVNGINDSNEEKRLGYTEALEDLIPLFTGERDCVEGSRNGKLFCEVHFDGEKLVSTEDFFNNHDDTLKLLEGAPCSSYPGCKGYVNHCSASLEILSNSCGAGKKESFCEELGYKEDYSFLSFLINSVYVSDASESECIDSDGDGWGWIEATRESCVVQDLTRELIECVDTDGDGWGWDGTKTCIP